MGTAFDVTHMTPIEDLSTPAISDAAELGAMAEEAKRFLGMHSWCRSIGRGYLDRAWAGILAAFYFETDAAAGADDSVWIIVGDVPPAHLDVPSCPNGAVAIESYVDAMQELVDHALRGAPLEGLIAVYRRNSLVRVPPTKEFAEMLGERLEVIRSTILPECADEMRE